MASDKTVMAMIRASRPTFRNPHDKVAFAVHASCIASGFVLLATGPSAFSDDPFSSALADEVGIDHWNDFEDTYGFIYSTPEGNSKKVLIKCIVMNGKLLVDALWEGASAPCHLELNVQDYVENGGANYDSQYKNFGKLVEEINKEILSKGSPAVESSTQSSSSEKGGIRDTADRRGAEFDDPYQHSGSIPPGYVVPPIPGFGGSDIFPGPGAGVYPTRDIGGYGGMLVGPRDRRFFPGISGDPRLPGGFQGIPPPGARFDPFGPPDVPGFEPGRFIRDPTRPGSGRNHPDLEHFGGGSDFI